MQPPTKILVAEAESHGASNLSDDIRKQGWEVIPANDAGKSVTLAMRQQPAAVVIGPRLPGGGSLFVIKQLRALTQTAHLPVVVKRQTGGADATVYLTAGADECADDPAEVVQALKRLVASPRTVTGPPAELLEAPERLAALNATGLLDSAPSRIYDALTRLAASLLQVPASQVSLVDRDRQFFKSQVGVPEPYASARQTALSHSFCQWVVSSRDELVVSDARQNPVLQSNQAVKDLNVIAYAGVPLTVGQDQPIGSLCALDARPREWTALELDTLRDIGQIARAYLALEPQNGSGAPMSARDSIPPKTFIQVAIAAINGATRILRRGGPKLGVLERDTLFEIIDEQTGNLSGTVAALP